MTRLRSRTPQAVSPHLPAAVRREIAERLARLRASWPAEAAEFVSKLVPGDLPATPFGLSPGVTVVDAGRFLAWLQRDLRLGPASPRAVYGALQKDLVLLRELVVAAETTEAA